MLQRTLSFFLLPFVGIIFLFLLLPVTSCTATEAGISQKSFTNTLADTAQKGQSGLRILFLGDNGHHRPEERLQQVLPFFAERGIHFHYTDRQDDLNLKKLRRYDALMIYGNRSNLTQNQETALLTYINEGGGLVTVHSGSGNFKNSDAYVSLVGGSFKSHGTGTFRTKRLEPNHPIFDGVPDFKSWDETYVHMKHNPDKKILSVRVEGDHEEPWTWIRKQGDGRVFNTAWGHDGRTWGNEGFKKLLERGVRWTVGDWALEADFRLPEFTYGNEELLIFPFGEPWISDADTKHQINLWRNLSPEERSEVEDVPITKNQIPLVPEESRKYIVSDPAFEVELFASNPEVVNVIDMTWDEEGRLWVLESIDYPNDFDPDREGNDRIKILEDTDGDNKADEVTLFADNLNMPTSLVLHKNGVIVAQAPDILYLEDTNGDDKADSREILFSGWGYFDTHAVANNLQYGFDNQIWGAVGYSGFEGKVGGEEHRFSQALYRFEPDGTELEVISSTTNNTWGLGFNEEGAVFGSTANNNPAVHSIIPNRFYNKINGSENAPRLQTIANSTRIHPIVPKVRQADWIGRYTAGAGFEVYTAREFPSEYWNRIAFVSAPTGHVLTKFILEEKGSSYTADNDWNLLASRDQWFRPIQAKVGPDGALWVSDWYNLIVTHNSSVLPYVDERGEGNAAKADLRDKDHARIYRVIYKDNDNDEQNVNLKNATTDELVNTLKNNNMFWRLTAQRLLVERGDHDVLPRLYEMVQDESIDELGMNPGALHALWTIEGLGVLDGSNAEAQRVVLEALHHPASAVRRAALKALPRNQQVLDKILAAGFLPIPEVPGDMDYTLPTNFMMVSDPKVRVAALLAVAEMPASEQVGIATAELLVMEENANDRGIRDAITAAAVQNKQSFFHHIFQKRLSQRADSTFKANVKTAVERISKNYALSGSEISEEIIEHLFSLKDSDPIIGTGFLTGILEGWPENEEPAIKESEKEKLKELEVLPEVYRDDLNALAEKWGSPGLFGSR
jgi:putative membrane-bound dehydrogenase-like protein